MSNYVPAEQLEGPKASSLKQKLHDIWWRVATSEGSIWNLPIIVWKADGTAEPIKSTPAVELGYNKLNNKILRDKLDLVLANQDKIIKKLGA